VQHFERHNTVVPLVLGEIHCRHSAASELAVDVVRAGECRAQPLEWKGQD